MSTGTRRDQYNPVAESIPFDNSTNGFVADDVQKAIEEVASGGGSGVSPGFRFTRSSNVNAGTYLQIGAVPSNKTGNPVDLEGARINQITISNEEVSTFTLEIEEHDGVTFTSLGTWTLTSQRGPVKFAGLNVSVSAGKELAAKILTGSCKNPVVIVYIKGSTI